jgi:uncharacterized protein involved in outer membrane biogenesis
MNFASPRLVVWIRRAAWAVGGLLLLWAVAWAGLPWVLKDQAQTRLSALLGRQVSVGSVEFAPWSLELTVHDFAIATADGGAAQLAVDRLYVDAELQSVLRLAPVVDAIRVEGVKAQLTHTGQGHYDIDDVLARLQSAPDAEPSAPPRFALYNLELVNANLDFHDQGVRGPERLHTLRNVQLSVPFISSLNSQRDVVVVPHLAFVLNGSAFDSAAQGTPFAQTRSGEAQLQIRQFDLEPYLPYVPAGLPVRLRSAVLDADLKLDFRQAETAALNVSGEVTVQRLALDDAAGAPLLAVRQVRATLASLEPLQHKVVLSRLEITQPSLQLSRNAQGQLNVVPEPSQTNASAKDAIKKEAAGAEYTLARGQNGAKNPATAQAASAPVAPAAAPGAKPESAGGWLVQLDTLAVTEGDVQWRDAQPIAHLALTNLAFTAKGVQWPMKDAADLELQAQLKAGSLKQTDSKDKTKPGSDAAVAALRLQAHGTDQEGSAQLEISATPLALAQPYLSPWLRPAVQGKLDAKLGVQWKEGKALVTAPMLRVQDAALLPMPTQLKRDVPGSVAVVSTPRSTRASSRPARELSSSAMPRFSLLEVTDVQLDPAARAVSVGKVVLRGASAGVRRDADGRWMAESWLPSGAPTPAAPPVAAKNATAPWSVALKELKVDGARVAYADRYAPKPVRLDVSDIQLALRNATLAGTQPVPLTVSARFASGQAEPGQLRYEGKLAWAPVLAQGQLHLQDFPLHALAPYASDLLNWDLERADASFKGHVRFADTPAGPELSVQGDAQLDEVRVLTGAGTDGIQGEELLQWKSLQVPGVVVAVAPGQATRVATKEAVLSDFYARIIINPQGRINLQDLVRSSAAAPAGATPAVASVSVPVAKPAASPPASTAPVVRLGAISLINGRVQFSDRFIKPNYTARLSELTGRLGAFTNQTQAGVVQLADLTLRGRAEGTAVLEIDGKVNPLATPLALDVTGKVRDLELPPLSPYAIKYAGYGIERGKLSVDVHYAVQANGQLTASNKLVLNQLSFGDKVEGAPKSLPVKLAVALLADRNGVIDLDLPISGSLNDPEFKVGAVVWKVITNLLARAVTAPFSLLANLLGGASGSELSTVAFAPGRAALSASARAGLDKVAKALVDRPNLNLTVQGEAQLESELDAIRQERLHALLVAEKRRRAGGDGAAADAVRSYTEEEMPVLLRAAYRRADFPKPKNLIGLTKDIPVADMQALLLANMAVDQDAVRDLALQRGVVTRDYLLTQQVPAERLFLSAVKTDMPKGQAKPQAQLTLGR